MSIQVFKYKAIIYNPYPLKGGGGEIQKNLYEVISKSLSKFEVEVFSTANTLTGFQLYISRLFKVFKNRSKLTSTDLLIIQSIFDPGSILIGYYARQKNIKYFVIPRGDYVPNNKNVYLTKSFFLKRLIWFFFGKKLVKHATSLIVTSDFEKNRLIEVSARKNHIEIIPDPTFEKIFEDVLDSQLIDSKFYKFSKYPFALWLGRFSKEKGLELLIDAWLDVFITNKDSKLLLIGSITHQDEFDKISKKIIDLKLSDSIFIFNWVSGIEKNFLLSNARCLLLPSFYESFGIVVSESLSFRTPVIVSDGTPWQGISKFAGFCIPRDTKIWSESIKNYIQSKEKIKVPEDTIFKTLNPFSKTEISVLWKSLFTKYL